ncbi:lysylphosphatidylglycerol synthase transmembrane domain-containing protein [Stenotrophomonas rhizophila]|uniref:lysylphosphatidylglycerol synthase transmembrane domain-containing protein n=1 Tax=Stenotrophomonas rhizophila TaxID=216778 RepID=UPI001E62723A|nr:lysylphosphatidylglycerol synthase transmembrane domain-containing protein [Stenotrophomonas rhizophila]MCC7634078.1 flippase-like domain-containing protein [Stenotrophomonas rhizophila]MCC7662774.1 flippase-like domain-containing protein [Stenotrophomonas rhizophila]
MRPLPDAPPAVARPVDQRRRSLAFLLVVGAGYLALLLYVDHGNGILARLGGLGGPLAICASAVLISFALRYQRWRSALSVQGHARLPWLAGLRAYLAGFAFTVSPGKAGELLRIRYFGRLQVPSRTVLSTFIYERGLDLLVITALGLGAASLIPAFGTLVGVVTGLLVVLCLAMCWSWLQGILFALSVRLPGRRIRQLATFLLDGARLAGPLLRSRTVAPGLLMGALAWTFNAAAFAYLCQTMGIHLSWPHALGIYPIAMLAGALSFVPGGVGTTEAAIVVMLGATGAALDVALAAAVGIRLVTLWLAIGVGMLAMLSLEVGPATREPS